MFLAPIDLFLSFSVVKEVFSVTTFRKLFGLNMFGSTGGSTPVPAHRCYPSSPVAAEDGDGGENRGSTQVGSSSSLPPVSFRGIPGGLIYELFFPILHVFSFLNLN